MKNQVGRIFLKGTPLCPLLPPCPGVGDVDYFPLDGRKRLADKSSLAENRTGDRVRQHPVDLSTRPLRPPTS